ncbi:MAG: hypothetical protein Q9193_002958, partial [Seirophora villosa]
SIVCLVGSMYLLFNRRQQNLQIAIDPGAANAATSNIPAATDISSGVDSASHSELSVPGTVDGSTRDQALGTRHGTPDASAQSHYNRPNLMEFDFGPEFNSNVKMVQPADNRRTIHDDIEKWIKYSWITRDQANSIRFLPRRMQTRSELLFKLNLYETRYQNETGVTFNHPFDVYGTPVSYHYDLIKCSFMFRLWTRQTRINGLPEQYEPDLATDPAPDQFLPEDEDAKSVITSATTMN